MTTTEDPNTYRFFVDGKAYQTNNRFITGEEIRALAAVPSRLRLFQGEQSSLDEQKKDGLDRQLMRHERVDLSTPGEEKFYTLEPPTMDIY